MQDVFRSPEVLLASFLSSWGRDKPELALVSGPSGSGKTTWCQRLVDQARSEGNSIAGLLSLPVYAAGVKAAIDLQNARTGERQRLASRRGDLTGEGGEGPAIGEWQFNLKTLAWGNQILGQLLADGLDGIDLLVLDELGPLELQLGEGLQIGLNLIDAWVQKEEARGLACVVVRPSLIPFALTRWPEGQIFQAETGGWDDPR